MDVSSVSTIRNFPKDWTSSDGSPAKPLTTWEYLNFSSSMHQAAAFSTLFWPNFVVHGGRIFLQERFDPTHYAALLEQGLTASEAQVLINHVHVDDLFSHSDAADAETASYLADVLREAWTASSAKNTPTASPGSRSTPGSAILRSWCSTPRSPRAHTAPAPNSSARATTIPAGPRR